MPVDPKNAFGDPKNAVGDNPLTNASLVKYVMKKKYLLELNLQIPSKVFFA